MRLSWSKRRTIWLTSVAHKGSSSSNENSFSNLWSIILKTNIPPKVHMTFWRLCNNIVPSKKNLATKHITTDLICVLCHSHKESISHILGDCHFARCTWLSSPIGPLRFPNGHISFKLWAVYLAVSLPHNMFETFILICSTIWGCRNNMLWNNHCDTPDLTVVKAFTWWQGFLQANTPRDNPEDKVRLFLSGPPIHQGVSIEF